MYKFIQAYAVADLNAASDTTAATFVAPLDGKIMIGETVGVAEEAIGTMTTTNAVVSIEVDGQEVGTLTPTPSDVIGTAYVFTPDGTIATSANGDGSVQFTTGDVITVKTKTQAVGGTVTGTIRVNYAFEFGDAS